MVLGHQGDLAVALENMVWGMGCHHYRITISGQATYDTQHPHLIAEV